MNAEYVIVYDQSGDMLGVLENASDVSYVMVHNDLWTASFSLPSADPKNGLCQAHNLVHLPDGSRDTGLYRIIGIPTSEETAQGGVKTYSLEHVMATLLDDVLFGYHEIGGNGVTTAQVIQYILDRQTTARWVLGECDFTDQYAYKYENTSLLSALLSLGGVLTEEYTWRFDTTTSPWQVSLKRADATPGCGIHYLRNMVGIEKSMDATTLVTRLYLLGYGEGVNQLTIREVNGGVPYIDADTVATWGVKCSVYADTRVEDAATLKARGDAVLARLKNPYISYTASAIDLARQTGLSWDTFMPGKLVKVMDGEHGIDMSARIVSISKSDVGGRPGEIDITIANAARDAADSINTLADRLGISELYSQGATNLYSQQYADNADASHPAIMRVYVPSGCVRINQMLLSWNIEAFRAYETGAAAGGGTTQTTSSGGQSTQTSSAGGASERTSAANGATTVTVEQTVVTNALATSIPYRSDVGGAMRSVDANDNENTLNSTELTSGSAGDDSTGYAYYAGALRNDTGSAGSHAHTVDAHGHAMGHVHNGPSHTHTVAGHTHSGPSHTHSLNAHTHSFSGSDSVANGHTHKVTCAASGTVVTSQGVSTNGTHSVSISGTTGGSSGSTGSAGAGNTGSTSLTTDAGGSGETGGAKYSGGTYRTNTGDASPGTSSDGSHTHAMQHTHTAAAHTHTVPPHHHIMLSHTHNMNHYHTGVANITIPSQEITIPSHRHTVTIDDHTHSVSVPAHTHDLTLADHVHEIIYGIFEGSSASNVAVYVDGTQVPAASLTASEMDIVAYLAKDEDGKITRGTWHEIKIVPDTLTRIEANLFVQTFVQSVGGGDY